MSRPTPDQHPPPSSSLHPAVYKAMLGVALWFVLAIWWGFIDGGEMDFELAVVSVFIFISVVLPLIALRTWRRHGRADSGAEAELFQDWAFGEFETRQSRPPGKEAAMQALLPIAAVAFGMTAFALLAHFVV